MAQPAVRPSPVQLSFPHLKQRILESASQSFHVFVPNPPSPRKSTTRNPPSLILWFFNFNLTDHYKTSHAKVVVKLKLKDHAAEAAGVVVCRRTIRSKKKSWGVCCASTLSDLGSFVVTGRLVDLLRLLVEYR